MLRDDAQAPFITTAKNTLLSKFVSCSCTSCKLANRFKTHVDFIHIHERENKGGKDIPNVFLTLFYKNINEQS